QRKAVLSDHRAGDEWPVAIVDRDQMLVMKREMPDALGNRFVRRGPLLAALNHIRPLVLQGPVKHYRSRVAGPGKHARRSRILTFGQHGAKGQHDTPLKAAK